MIQIETIRHSFCNNFIASFLLLIIHKHSNRFALLNVANYMWNLKTNQNKTEHWYTLPIYILVHVLYKL